MKYFGYLKSGRNLSKGGISTYHITEGYGAIAVIAIADPLMLIQPFRDLLDWCDEARQIRGRFGDFYLLLSHFRDMLDKPLFRRRTLLGSHMK